MISSIISEVIGREDLQIIVFDGFSGSGKTTTAKSVADCIQGLAIDTDDYVNRKDDGAAYLDCLDFNSLSSKLGKALGEEKKVCLSGMHNTILRITKMIQVHLRADLQCMFVI
ncbi:TPA: hypothetical protein NJZ52_004395 [Vibrio parahaemolyticus]|nr:hypothetical protein [Vibrio parahaemolyticus]